MSQMVRVVVLLALVSAIDALDASGTAEMKETVDAVDALYAVDASGSADMKQAKKALKEAGVYKTYLNFLKSSGLESNLTRYIQKQPITMLLPNDKAFAALPKRYKSQLAGSKLVKLLQYQIIIQKLPLAFLKVAQPGAGFRTVYGEPLVKIKSASKDTVIFGAPGATKPSQGAMVVRGDLAAAKLLLLCLHGTNKVLIPPNVFK